MDVALDALGMRGILAMALTTDVLGPLSDNGVAERASRQRHVRVQGEGHVRLDVRNASRRWL